MVKAILFDMDGVIVDSEVVYAAALKDMLHSEGIEITIEDAYSLSGATSRQTNEYVSSKLNVPYESGKAKLDQYYHDHPPDYKKIFRQEVLDIMAYLKRNGYLCALVSSSPLETIEKVMELCGISGYLDIYVSGEQFAQSKPNPEIYLYTIDKLKINANEALAVEDSYYGVLSANRAGVWVAGLQDTRIIQDLSTADYKIKELTDIYDVILKINKRYQNTHDSMHLKS